MKFTKASDSMQLAHGKVDKPDNYRIDGNRHIGGQGDQNVEDDLMDIHKHGGRYLAKAPNLHNEMNWDEAHALKNQFHAEAERKKQWDEEVFKLFK